MWGRFSCPIAVIYGNLGHGVDSLQQHSAGDEPIQGGDSQGNFEAVKVSEIENLLAQLPGIIAARLMVTNAGDISAIHILATSERGTQHLLGDIENSLFARWGLKVEPDKIYIARLEGGQKLISPVNIRLGTVTVNTDALWLRCDVKVTLHLSSGDDEQVFVGSASGTSSTVEQPRIVAVASLDALNQVIHPDGHFVFEDARLVQLSLRQLAVVLFFFHRNDGYQQLVSGCAPVMGDPVEAVIQACLQGADRIIQGRSQWQAARGCNHINCK